MSYDLVIFDWDGTVMDSTARIVTCMHDAARDLSLPALEDEQVRGIIGLGLPEAILTLYPFLDEVMVTTMRERYAHHFVLAERSPSVPYPGARDTLLALREQGMQLAVATGKSRKGLDRVWTNTGLGALFHASRCADESRSKPHPAMVLELLEELRVAPERALMVGDTTFDLDMAEAAGVDRVAVSYGAHTPERLRQRSPRAMIDALPQLLPLIGVEVTTRGADVDGFESTAVPAARQ